MLREQLEAEYANRFAAKPEYVWALKYDPAQPRDTAGRWSEIRYGGAKDFDKAEYDQVQLAHDTENAIFGYVQGGARHMNEVLRAEGRRARGEVERYEDYRPVDRKAIALLDEQLRRNRLSEDTVLFRTLSRGPVVKLKIGDVLQDDGFVSTTRNSSKIDGIRKDIGANPEYQWTLMVLAPKGLGHIDVNEELGPHGYDNQEEVILPRGTQFQVMSKGPGNTMTVKVVQSVAKFANILKWDESKHPRDKEGQFAFKRSPLEKKRRQFMALIRRGAREEINLNRMRIELADAWYVWSEDTKNRKRPLKADGAAAKKLPSYKAANELEKAFHIRFAEVTQKKRKLAEQARELLKVPREMRSKVEFFDDPKLPVQPAIRAHNAKNILSRFREFDGSGVFEPAKFTPEQQRKFIEVLGKDAPKMVENPDGTFSIPTVLRLSQSESPRAHADGMGIHIGSGRQLDAAVNHEVAHHIELRNGAVRAAAIALRESLASQPREVYKLNTVNRALDDTEEAVRGNFPDPYVAKLYPKDGATEIVSTGVEAYLADPITFAKDRPEHFNFIFDVMQGKYRESNL